MGDLYVLLKFEGLLLLIPQPEVQAVEIMADVHLAASTMGAIGWFGHEPGHGQHSPVFCLANDLSLLIDVPDTRQYFVLIKAPELPVGLTCDEVEDLNIRRQHLSLQPLPTIMKMPHSPLTHLVVYEDQVGCVCAGPALVDYLAHIATLYEQTVELNSSGGW